MREKCDQAKRIGRQLQMSRLNSILCEIFQRWPIIHRVLREIAVVFSSAADSEPFVHIILDDSALLSM